MIYDDTNGFRECNNFFSPSKMRFFPSKVPASYGPTVSKPSFGPRQARLDETLEGLASFTPGKPKQLTWWKITPFFNRRYHLPWVGFFRSNYVCLFFGKIHFGIGSSATNLERESSKVFKIVTFLAVVEGFSVLASSKYIALSGRGISPRSCINTLQ